MADCTTIDWKRKLTSRKLWMSVATLVFMIMVFVGADEDSATQVVAMIMAGATVIGYVIGEGLADKGGTVSGDVIVPGVEYPTYEVSDSYDDAAKA